MKSINKKCTDRAHLLRTQPSVSALPPSLGRRVAVLAALTLVLINCDVSRAGTTAVSNLANSDLAAGAPVRLDEDGYGQTYAQSFTTGLNPVTLASVTLQMQTTIEDFGGFTVSLYTDGGGDPGVSLGVLTGDDTPSPAGLYTYTAPTATLLSAARTYWIVASVQSAPKSVYSWQPTSDLSETGLAGWSMGTLRLQFIDAFSPAPWQRSEEYALKMAVNIADTPTCCPLPKGDWKNDPATPGCVFQLLKSPPKGNAAATLVQQWIAAVYNLGRCLPVDPAKYGDIKVAITSGAPGLLGLPPLEVPYSLPDLCNVNLPHVKNGSPLGQQMLALAKLLEAYNNAFYNDCDGDGFTPSQGDCNDANPAVHPGAAELIDGIDNDCNGLIDDDTCPCPYPGLPDPVIVFESVDIDGRYNLDVPNYASFPDCIFASTGAYGPCGENLTPSRTWVDIYNASDDSYIYGFCAFGQASDLNLIWFGRPTGTEPPAEVYIVITDRKCGQTYRSNTIQVPSN